MLRSIFSLLAVALLELGVVLAQSSPDLDPNHFYSVDSNTPLTLKGVDLSVQTVASIDGSGAARISFVTEGGEVSLESFDCRLMDARWCVFPLANLKADVDVRCPPNITCQIKLHLFSGEQNLIIEGNKDDYHTFTLAPSLQNFSFIYKISNEQQTLPTPDATNKMMFLLESKQDSYHYNLRHSINNYIEFEVDKRTTDGSYKKISSAPAILWSTVVCTISDRDEEFCLAKECQYRVKVKASSVPHVMFSVKTTKDPQRVPLNSASSFIGSYYALQQTYENMDSRYIFEVQEEGDLIFDLDPMEGNPDIFVNIGDQLNFDTSKYKFKSDKENMESLLISSNEFKVEAGSSKLIYCVIKSKVTSTFYFSVQFRKKDNTHESLPIRLNKFYSGALRDQEMFTFVLDLKPEIPQTMSAFVSLKSRGGNPDLFIKDCESEVLCSFTKEEIAEKALRYKHLKDRTDVVLPADDSLFLFSEKKDNDDDLFFAVNAVPGGSEQFVERTGESLPKFSNKLKLSRYNKICIAVVGHSDSFSQVSEYSLIVTGRYAHTVLKEYRTEHAYLNPKDEVFFVYNPRTLPDQALGIKIQIGLGTGDADIYFSSLSKYPSKDNHDIEFKVDNDQSRAEVTHKEIVVPKEKLNAQGVYLGVYASKQSFLQIIVTYDLPKVKAGEYAELIPDVPVYRFIASDRDFMFDDEFDAFVISFYMNDENQKDLFVKISKTLGYSYTRIYAGLKGKALSPHDCSQYSDNEFLIIRYEELKQLTDGQTGKTEIALFVSKIDTRGAYETRSQVEYEVVLVGPSSKRDISQRGVPIEDYLQSREHNLHYHQFLLDTREGFLAIHTEALTNQYLNVRVGFNKQQVSEFYYGPVQDAPLNLGDSHYHGWEESGQSKSLVFDYSTIKDFCTAAQGSSSSDKNKKLLQEAIEDQVEEEEFKPLVCVVYIRIGSNGMNTASGTPYRLWVAKSTDRLRLVRGQRYTLPAPDNYTLGLEVPVSTLPSGAIITTAPENYNKLDVVAWVISLLKGTTQAIFSTNIYRKSGAGTQVLSIPADDMNEEEMSRRDAESFVIINVTKPHTGHEIPALETSYFDSSSKFSIVISNDISELKLGETVHGQIFVGKRS